MNRFVKLVVTPELLELQERYPDAFLLLMQAGMRARWKDEPNAQGLRKGEAFIGDFRAAGIATERRYRTAKEQLKLGGWATSKKGRNGTTLNVSKAKCFAFGNLTNDGSNDGSTTDQKGQNSQNATDLATDLATDQKTLKGTDRQGLTQTDKEKTTDLMTDLATDQRRINDDKQEGIDRVEEIQNSPYPLREGEGVDGDSRDEDDGQGDASRPSPGANAPPSPVNGRGNAPDSLTLANGAVGDEVHRKVVGCAKLRGLSWEADRIARRNYALTPAQLLEAAARAVAVAESETIPIRNLMTFWERRMSEVEAEAISKKNGAPPRGVPRPSGWVAAEPDVYDRLSAALRRPRENTAGRVERADPHPDPLP